MNMEGSALEWVEGRVGLKIRGGGGYQRSRPTRGEKDSEKL